MDVISGPTKKSWWQLRSGLSGECRKFSLSQNSGEGRVHIKDPGFFSSRLMALEHRWFKCIILEGNYIEKEEIDLTQK